MPGKKITLQELARMVKFGFDQTATKTETHEGFAALNARLDGIEGRLHIVERLLTSNRIERIEDDVRLLKTKIGLP